MVGSGALLYLFLKKFCLANKIDWAVFSAKKLYEIGPWSWHLFPWARLLKVNLFDESVLLNEENVTTKNVGICQCLSLINFIQISCRKHLKFPCVCVTLNKSELYTFRMLFFKKTAFCCYVRTTLMNKINEVLGWIIDWNKSNKQKLKAIMYCVMVLCGLLLDGSYFCYFVKHFWWIIKNLLQ